MSSGTATHTQRVTHTSRTAFSQILKRKGHRTIVDVLRKGLSPVPRTSAVAAKLTESRRDPRRYRNRRATGTSGRRRVRLSWTPRESRNVSILSKRASTSQRSRGFSLCWCAPAELDAGVEMSWAGGLANGTQCKSNSPSWVGCPQCRAMQR